MAYKKKFDEEREERHRKLIKQGIKDGTLVVRKMTAEERKANPPLNKNPKETKFREQRLVPQMPGKGTGGWG